MPNLIEGIQAECNRCRELVKQYDEIGQAGAFVKVVLEQAIRDGETAIASSDAVDMVHALVALRECQ
jgi:hypothetical protein